MRTVLNCQKADGKWYQLTCYDYYVEGEKLTSPNMQITPCERRSCCNCGNSACTMHGVNCHKFIPRTA
jgi:hypothetical protein